MKAPVIRAVSATPKVASIAPSFHTGFMSSYLVSIPPENRIMLSAIMPMNCAAAALSKAMPR